MFEYNRPDAVPDAGIQKKPAASDDAAIMKKPSDNHDDIMKKPSVSDDAQLALVFNILQYFLYNHEYA